MAYFGCGRKALFYKGFSEVKVARTTALWAIVCKQILLVLIPLSLRDFEESAAISSFLLFLFHISGFVFNSIYQLMTKLSHSSYF